MNQIFRVIWNHATQSWVAVSELASAKGKTKSKTISKLAALSLVAGTALSMDAMAASSTITAVSKTNGNLAILTNNQDSIDKAQSDGATTPKNVIYIGNGNVPSSIGDEFVAIGNDMNGNSAGHAGDTLIGNRVRSGGGGQDSFSTAVGYGAQVAGPSVAIGVGTSSDIGNAEGWKGIKYSGISIGAFSRVSGTADGGVAMGAISFADQTGSVAIGQLSGAASLIYDREVTGTGGGGVVYRGIDETTGGNLVSIGAEAGARSTSSVAIGTQSTTSQGNDSIAMGTNSAAIKHNSIAIGHAAIAGGHTQADINALNAKKRSIEAHKVDADKRLLDKTAAAEANPTAENKFQLSAAKAAVERLALMIKRINDDIGRLSTDNSETTGAIAIGNQAKATNQNSTALGDSTRANIATGVALGSSSETTAAKGITGFSPTTQGTSDIRANTYKPLDGRVLTSTLGGVSVGSATNTRQINHVAAGTADDDAVNVAQLRSVNLKIAGNTNGETASAKSADMRNTATSKADVLLDSQTLNVVSSKTDLLTTDATNNTITITPKTTKVDVNNDKTKDDSGKATTPTTNGLVTATDLADTLNNMYWKIEADKNDKGDVGGKSTEEVKAGNKVRLIAGEGVRIDQSGRDFTFSVKKVVKEVDKNSDASRFFKAGDNIEVNVVGEGKDQHIEYGLKPNITINSVSTNGGAKLEGTALSGLSHHLVPDTPNPKVGTLPETANNQLNEAATVNDVLNAGWNLTEKGVARDFVKPYDTVDFIDGKGTSVNVTTDADNKVSHIKYDVKAADDSITVDDNGIKVNTGSITPVTKDEGDKKSGQVAPKEGDTNKVASVGDVANAINNAFWKATSAATKDGEVSGTNVQSVKAGDTVTFEADKNIKITQDKGKFTFATKDDVEFNTVTVGKPAEVYTNKNGKPLTKTKDGKYTDPDGNEVPEKDVVTSNVSPVKLATEKAIPADNNQDGKAPTTALNVTSTDGKPTQITGVGSVLSNESIPTNTNGTPTAQDKQPKLVNLGTKPNDKGEVKPLPDNVLNSAATVRDLANMGWIVGAPENGYVDTVKNANQVDFIGKGISVTGKTNDKGVREITIAVKDGEVVKPNKFTAKVNGKDTPVTKVGDQYYNTADIDPKTGKPNAKANPVTPDEGTTPTNAGDGYVTGNKVATAIQKSGFVVGKQTEKLSAADFKNEDEKVNPDDELRFADGNNTKVKLATKESVDKDGNKVTTTTVKVDVTGLPVQYTDKNGTPVTKVGDKYFTVDDKGNPTTTEVAPADLTTNMVNPAAAPNEIGAPTTLGNVKSNLPETKNGNNPTLNQAAPTDEDADKVKNNASTVSDVLNAGWNLQNNGEAKDFVKPYDTVNFVDGKGTKAVVKTEEDGTTSNVKFDIDTGSITNNADGSVQGPVVTPEMTKALEDATNTLNNLPANAPASVRKAAEQAVADAANNIANVANKVATAQDVANAINKSGFTLTTSANGGEKISGTPEMINPGKKVEMVAGKNMTVKQESNGKVTYATASNVTFDSVQFGDNGPKITNNGGNINVGTATGAPTKITGVAPGEISATSKDAVNGSQLYAMGNKLQGQINKLGNRMNAGMATSAAMANLLQPHKPGQSVATAGIGQHKNQSAVAVGYSRISDNGKYGVRFSMGANTQGEVTGGAAVGYFW